MEFQLKENLLLGAGCAPGRGERQEDLAFMAGLNVQCCRMDIDWAQIEPFDGVFDEVAFARYREEIQTAREKGIPVLLALFHCSLPAWLEERGGFARSDSVTYFLRYVRKTVESLGDLVSEYITVDEANLYAYNGYLAGARRPGKKSLLDMARVLTNLTAAHIEAYGLIRKTRLQMGRQDTKVGFANHLRVFAPKDAGNPVHRFWASRAEQLFQGSLTRAMCTGRPGFPVGRHPAIVPGRYCDFHAVTYYTRSTVSGPADGVAEHCPVDGLGREIYPQGLAEVCRKVYGLLPRPIYVSGNGACGGSDLFRARYIAEHLQALCGSGLPVERYYYWRLCDGWEWDGGDSAQFGLAHVDHGTGERTVKRSGEFYRRVIREGGVSEALFKEFCDVEYARAPSGGDGA